MSKVTRRDVDIGQGTDNPGKNEITFSDGIGATGL